ncbi:MAG: DUF1524 domain-containing protein [Candidatus Nanopelagicales bacterium]
MPDPRRPTQLRYWDGVAWTQHYSSVAPPPPPTAQPVRPPRPQLPAPTAGTRSGADTAPAASGIPAWLVSWPAILVGFVLCFVPGLVLLWLRPGTRTPVKAIVSGAAVSAVVLGFAAPNALTVPSSEVALAPSESPAAIAPSSRPASSAPSVVASSSAPAPSETPSATPTPSAGTSTPVPKSAAVVALAGLTVKGRAPKTGYTRERFGPAWVDVDRNGCDTRNDMLIRDLTDRTMSGSCKVMAGTLDDPYTASTIRFVRGGASEVDVDHVVSLSDAWQKGATPWPYAKRVAFANDPLNLQPTDSSANRQKGDGDAATWLPPNKAYRCDYVARQIAVKKKYRLWVTGAERDAMLRVLGACPGQALPAPGPQPTIASNTGGPEPGTSPTAAPKPAATKPSSSGSLDPRYGTCKEAIAHGLGPYIRGVDPEYAWYIDRDKDGKVCER